MNRLIRWIPLALAGLIASMPAVTAAALMPQSTLFSAAAADGFDPELEDYSVLGFDYVVGEGTAAVGGLEAVGHEARASTSYGVNRVYAAVRDGDFFDGPFAYSISVWADRFLITGGTGEFSAPVSLTLESTVSPSSYSEALAVVLKVPESDFQALLAVAGDEEFIYDSVVYGDIDPSLLAGAELALGLYHNSVDTPGNNAEVATDFITGQYGEAFYLVTVLAAYAEVDGEVDAMHTAFFGLSAPDAGSIIGTGSGAIYAAAVPEADSIALFSAGLALLVLARRRFARAE